MLYMTNKNGVGYSYRVGQSTHKCTNVADVYADGDELEYIKNNFKNIPICLNKDCNRWYGEIAQFIWNNL